MISPLAIKRFLNRKLLDSGKAKDFSKEAIDRKIAKLVPQPHFVLPPRHHQKVSFLLGLKYSHYLMLLDMGLGKAVPLDEPILTPRGFRAMGNLEVGSYVIGKDGEKTRVTGVFPQGKKEVFLVRFSDGSEVRSTDDHLWRVWSAVQKRRGQPGKVLPLSEIRKNLFDGAGNARHYIPMTSPVRFKKWIGGLPVHPYVLGVLLGDAHLGKGITLTLGKTKKFVIDKVDSLLPCGHRLTIRSRDDSFGIVGPAPRKNAVLSYLWEAGVMRSRAATKHIPRRYLLAKIQERLHLLHGLMDTDGYAGKNGVVQYTTASTKLRDGVEFIVRSLGGVTRRSEKKVEGVPYYTLTISLPEGMDAFSLPRKLNRRLKAKRKYYPARAIVSVTPAGKEECQCISVEAPDGLFVMKDFVVTHNSKLLIDLFRYIRDIGGEDQKSPIRSLVLVPAVSNVSQWEAEVAKHGPELAATCVDGKGDEARKAQLLKGDVAILTYAGFTKLVCSPRKNRRKKQKAWEIDPKKLGFFQDNFDFFIYDEITQLMNKESTRSKACRKLSWGGLYCYGLTGTIFGHDPMDAWNQFYTIDKGEALGPTKGLFRDAFYRAEFNKWGYPEYKFRKRMKKDVSRMMRHSSIRYEESECDDLPKKVYIDRPVEFSNETWKYYNRLVEELNDANGSYRVMQNTFVRMRQLCSGYLSVKDPEGQRQEIRFKTNPKLDALLEVIQEIPEDKKIVVFLEYKKSGEIVCEALKKAKVKHERLYSGTVDKRGTIDRFLNGSSRVLVSSSAGAFGGNWQSANYCAFFESPTSPIVRKQEEKRIHRIGQTKRCFIIDLFVKKSVESGIRKALKEGYDLFDAIVEGRASIKKRKASHV